MRLIDERVHFARTLSFYTRDALLNDHIHEKYVTAFERDPATGDDIRKLSKCDIAILEVSKLSACQSLWLFDAVETKHEIFRGILRVNEIAN